LDPDDGTWTCTETKNKADAVTALALGKFAGKSAIAASATGASLKVREPEAALY